jgi:predicted CopG family antitoxin
MNVSNEVLKKAAAMQQECHQFTDVYKEMCEKEKVNIDYEGRQAVWMFLKFSQLQEEITQLKKRVDELELNNMQIGG